MLLEDLTTLTGLHVQPTYLNLEIAGELGPPLRLVDVPELRQTMGEYLLDLVQRHQRSWFGQTCGRCGNSCRRPQILVREQEILPLQMQLGLTESQFRERYLGPAGTWNAGDGLMRHTPEGACPLLTVTGSGPHSTSCSVHDIRPRSCREVESTQSYCQKDPAQLLEELGGCWVTPELTTVYPKGGGQQQTTTPAEVWQAMGAAVARTPRPRDRRVAGVVESICEILDQEMAQIDPLYDYSVVLGRIHSMLRQAASMMQDQELNQKLEQAWARYRNFQAMLSGEPGQPTPVPVYKARAWTSLRLSEEELLIQGDSRRLPVALGQAFLHSLLSLAHEELQQALCQPDPPCYMCGECCRHYVVEIHPSDISRLSQHLRIPTADFVEQYTAPARFGWNLQDRILNKRPVPTYSRKLLELSLVGEAGDQQCVFLERREDGLFYCQVHSHKPQVCRGYEANHSLCRQTNQRENAGRQADRLKWVEIYQHTVHVETQAGPLVLDRGQWSDLHAAACELEESVALLR